MHIYICVSTHTKTCDHNQAGAFTFVYICSFKNIFPDSRLTSLLRTSWFRDIASRYLYHSLSSHQLSMTMIFEAMVLGACLALLISNCSKLRVAKAIIWCLNEEEKQSVLTYIQGQICKEQLSNMSNWSMVSGQPGSGSPGGSLAPSSPLSASGSPGFAKQNCKHLRVTKRGSNHFQSRLRCKDCGELIAVSKSKGSKAKP